jgi:hypothetical protein
MLQIVISNDFQSILQHNQGKKCATKYIKMPPPGLPLAS